MTQFRLTRPCARLSLHQVLPINGYIALRRSPSLLKFILSCSHADRYSYFTPLAITFSTRCRDLSILVALVVFNLIITSSLPRLRYARR